MLRKVLLMSLRDARNAVSLAKMQSRRIVKCTPPCVRTVAAKHISHLSRWKAKITIAANVLLREKKQKKQHKLSNIYCLTALRKGRFFHGENIVPVKLEIKKFRDKANGLYVAIALEKVKATEVSKQGNTRNGVTQSSHSIAYIIMAQLFRKINPNDEQFIKYIPDDFLNDLQFEAKEHALKKQSDFIYLSAVKRGDMETAQLMLDEAAKERYNNLGSQTQKMLLYFRGSCGTINTDYLTGGILYDHKRRYHRRRTG